MINESIPKEERTWAMFAHLAALSGYIGIPFGNVIGPLVIWLIKKEEMPYVDDQGKEALNFQISMTIYAIVSLVMVLFCIGYFMLIGVAVVGLIFTIIGSVKANDGEPYRYPFCIRFV